MQLQNQDRTPVPLSRPASFSQTPPDICGDSSLVPVSGWEGWVALPQKKAVDSLSLPDSGSLRTTGQHSGWAHAPLAGARSQDLNSWCLAQESGQVICPSCYKKEAYQCKKRKIIPDIICNTLIQNSHLCSPHCPTASFSQPPADHEQSGLQFVLPQQHHFKAAIARRRGHGSRF